MSRLRLTLGTFLNAAILLFAVWYAVGVVLMTTHWIPEEFVEFSHVWGDVVFLLLAALVTYLFSARLCGWGTASIICGIILCSAAAAELFGAKTGFPFGPYHYSDNLGPKILNLMPAIIPFCWLTIVLNAFWVIFYLFQKYLADPSAKLLMFISAAGLAVVTDFNLEPVASLIKLYWVWLDGGLGYLGIPGVNFFGWWMVSFIMLTAIYGCLPEKLEITEPPWISYALLAAINLLFGLVNFRAGFLLPVFVALNTFGLLGILLFLRETRIPEKSVEPAEAKKGPAISESSSSLQQ
jgi:uncharacterized membrane protein